MTNSRIMIMLTVLIACLVVLALTGCQRPAGPDDPADGHVEYFTDTHTGCQYILWDGDSFAGGITPRMGKDGKQVCA